MYHGSTIQQQHNLPRKNRGALQIDFVMSASKILVTGVTGYIGGTILYQILTSKNPLVVACQISVLLRDDKRADVFRSDSRIHCVHTMRDLNDTEAILSAASQNDVVIQCGPGYHKSSAQALIQGLARRQAGLRSSNDLMHNKVYYIHTDGTSNIADKPITRTYINDRIFSDADQDIYEYLKKRNEIEDYPQRSVAISVLETGLAEEIATTIIMSPTIYGLGTGNFNRLTVQYPILMRAAMRQGEVACVGDGMGEGRFVHVLDLASLYELVLLDHLSNTHALPAGTRSFLFSETGSYQWKEVAQNIGGVGKELGVLRTDNVKGVTLKEAADIWSVPEHWCELGFAGNQRTEAVLAKRLLGWKPRRGRSDWENNFREEFKAVAAEMKDGNGGRNWKDEAI